MIYVLEEIAVDKQDLKATEKFVLTYYFMSIYLFLNYLTLNIYLFYSIV